MRINHPAKNANELGLAWQNIHRSVWNTVEPQGTHTICLCCRLLFYSKCTGFTVSFTYSDISLTMYINQWKINVELPCLWCIVVLLPQKRFFERFWMNLSSPLTVPSNVYHHSLSWSILNVSTVHLNGIWHLVWCYVSKPVLGGHPVFKRTLQH